MARVRNPLQILRLLILCHLCCHAVGVMDYYNSLFRPLSLNKAKVETLGSILKRHVQALRDTENRKVELVFLVDSSASVGATNFFDELKFVRKLLADFTVDVNATRVSVITFSSRGKVIRHVDHLTIPKESNQKCGLLVEEMPKIRYIGGGTYTLGAFIEAKNVLRAARKEAAKAIFLITDGFSNGGDPRPEANILREMGVKIFTFGIRNGNVRELFDMASEPRNETCYILDSFEEFEALARRALHEDLHSGSYILQKKSSCFSICKEGKDCCHPRADCMCGTHTGKYECLCQPGYYGHGNGKTGCAPCPAKTYKNFTGAGDVTSCTPCPDESQITGLGAPNASECKCRKGYQQISDTECSAYRCSMLDPPTNGYFVNNKCNNVFNAACGLRCRPGYELRGSSLRICQEDSKWSGTTTKCIMKSCPPLPTPKHGHMICSRDDFNYATECRFTCDNGFKLVGSRKRTCLAIAVWTGITTRCREITCQPLLPLREGTVSPSSCTEGEVLFGTTCQMSCSSQYTLYGSHTKQCTPDGNWVPPGNQPNQCIDEKPPFVQCPPKLVIEADPEEPETEVSWGIPLAVDNSGFIPRTIAVPALVPPAKLPIGYTTITYIAEDWNKNKAKCKVYIHVIDNTPPRVDKCFSPKAVVSQDKHGTVTWEEPLFSDNSGETLQIVKSHSPGRFPRGKTNVTYTATDKSGNNNTCVLEINVIPHPCEIPPPPVNGNRTCFENEEGVICKLFCMDDYAFAIPPAEEYFCAYDNIWRPENQMPFPDCSVKQISNDLVQEASFTFTGKLSCRDRQILKQIKSKFERKVTNRVNELCVGGIECSIDDMETTCEEDDDFNKVKLTLGNRRRRSADKSSDKPKQKPKSSQRKTILTFEFSLEGSVNSTGDTGEDRKSQKKLERTLKKVIRTLQNDAEGGDFDLLTYGKKIVYNGMELDSSNPKFKCVDGQILLRSDCVNCPVGTFFNVVKRKCESCSKGTYQQSEGAIRCLVCPNKTSTSQNHSKSEGECLAQCLPGSFSPTGVERCETCLIGWYQPEYAQTNCTKCPPEMTTARRGSRTLQECKEVCPRGYVSKNGLGPCFACPRGTFQPDSQKSACFECPNNASTFDIGSVSLKDCEGDWDLQSDGEISDIQNQQQQLPINACFDNPCINGGTCVPKFVAFTCKCPPGYGGIVCDKVLDECESKPCLNAGTCITQPGDYKCSCADGFKGKKCEIDIDECESSPCLQGGTCIDGANGFICSCPAGYQGVRCDSDINDCSDQPCRNGATCIDKLIGYECQCAEGFTGLSCEIEIDECLENPCRNNATCVDIPGDFRCDCLAGYTGRKCGREIDECKPNPCKNGAKCEDLLNDFVCHCLTGFRGDDCSITLDVNYQLDFAAAGIVDYAKIQFPHKPLNSLTVTFWMKSSDTLNYGTPFSYAVPGTDNAFTLSDYSGFAIYVNQEKRVTDLIANDDLWHHIVVTWSSNRGSWKIYQNGLIVDSGWDLSTGKPVQGGGMFVIGQEQDDVGGKFSSSESFVGSLTHLNVWDQELPLTTIDDMRVSCNKYSGNLLAWPDVFKGLHGSLRDSPSTFCEDCPIPAKPDFGKVEYTGVKTASTVTYSCLRGFNVAGMNNQLCLATGDWEAEAPECAKVECGYPGKITNGYTEGRKYSFDNRVRYICYKGFQLKGSKTRYCNEYGEWEGDKPECVEITCELPLLSENTKVSSPKSKYVPKNLVEFVCTPGTRMLTVHDSVMCQADGTWDKSVPTCDLQKCSSPPEIVDGAALNPATEYSVGGQASYECNFGYTFSPKATNTKGKISCLPSGQWESDLPVCEIVKCPEIPVVANAVSSGSGVTFLSTVQYTCNIGYKMIGQGDIECYELGEWSSEPPECRPVSCGPPNNILHGVIRGSDYELNSVLIYQCDTGYRLNTDKRRRCLQNASWSGIEPFCNPVSCPQPTNIINGQVLVEDIIFESVITYVCNEGYDLEGPEERSCLDSGKWSATEPKCEPVNCGPPPDVVHGTFVGLPPYVYGVVVTYSCNVGYRLVGNDQIICESSTFWSAGSPVCEQITCPEPTPPVNGYVNVLGLTYASGASYECAEGYVLDGVSLRTCQLNQTWTDSTPNCKATQCQKPDPVKNGDFDYKDLSIGSIVTYTCELAHIMDGEEVRRCQEDLTWSGQTVTCNPVQCPNTLNVTNGRVDITDTGFGSIAINICDEGYSLEGEEERFCNEFGEWSGEDFRCRIVECDKTGHVISNGQMIGNNYTYGSVINYVCDGGYTMLGSSSRICQSNGEWDKTLPVCQSVRCPSFILANGVADGFQRDFGSVVSYSCKKGFILQGPASRKCLSGGVWEGDDPICVKLVCPQIPDLLHGSFSSSLNGLTVNYRCDEGYTLNGASQRMCQDDGRWSLGDPFCEIISCPDLSSLIINGGWVIQSGFTFSEKATFECLDGYNINGTAVLTCEANGEWSDMIPSCVIVSCGEPGAVLNGVFIGSVYTFGSSIKYSCSDGYVLVGVTERLCGAGGDWSDSSPICQQIVCPDLENIEFGSVTIQSNTPTGLARYSCIPGYELFGEESRECLVTGAWEEQDPICAPIHCHHPHALDKGRIIGTDYHYQHQITYECFEGYELVGDSVRTCAANRRWNGTKPKCEIIRCEDLTHIPYGRIIGDNFEYGSSVTYVCNDGYELVDGTATRTCTKNWVWDGISPRCKRISCGDIPSIPFATIIGNETLFNTSNIIECVEGYISKGEPIITCLSTRSWNIGEFRCQIVSCPAIEYIQNGQVLGDDFIYGSKINFLCDIGSDLVGAEFLECRANGSWDSDIPRCQIVTCPEVVPIRFGKPNSTLNTYGTTIRYKCNKGYRLIENSDRFCLDYGEWDTPVPYCQILSCPLTINKITNGRLLTESLNFTVNSTARFECNEGYEMVGNELLMCTESGEWNSGVPSCIKINCPQPGGLDHGNVVSTDDLLTYSCRAGYILRGSTRRRCTSSGQWDFEAPVCHAVVCPDPPDLMNGEILGNNFTFGTQIEYLCDFGYTIVGSEQRNCESNGEWDVPAPYCEIISCGAPPVLYNGEIIGDVYTYTATVNYACGEGYLLVGADVRECLEDGSWSLSAPYCTRVTCEIIPIENGHIRDSPTIFYAGTFIAYECNPGYRLSGSSTVECGNDGITTSNETVKCIHITCPPLNNPANGVLINDDRTVGARAEFVCNPSYTLIGSIEVRCLEDGSWDGESPLCIQQLCPAPENIEHGGYRVSYQSNRVPDNEFRVDDRITYYCDSGYEASGSALSQCRYDSMWSHRPPVCLPVNCGIPPAVNYAIIEGQSYIYQSQVFYKCQLGFHMIGTATIECGDEGSWIGDIPRCVGDCGQPPVIRSATVEITDSAKLKRATYTCNYGTRLRGNPVAICDETGNWEYDIGLVCIEIYCDEPPILRFGAVLADSRVVGSEAKYVCDDGFRLVGSVNLVCEESGRWEGEMSYCEPVDCGEPPGPHPYLGRDFSFGKEVRYQCEKGFHVIGGDTTISCQSNGQWSGVGPVCEQNSCGVIELQPHMQVIRGDPVKQIYYNHTVEFACESNYVMVGEAILRCLATSIWSSNPPSCEPILDIVSFCDLHVDVRNSQSMQQGYSKGDTASVRCEKGHYSEGNMVTRCLDNGKWEVPSGRCRRKYCGRPRVKDIMNVIVQGQSFFFGDQVRYMCRPGLNPSRFPPVLTCKHNGRWDGEAACSAHCKLGCRNGGMCIGMNRCKCRPGYGGQQCEIPICILPCLNGGKCVAPYICSCPEGYGGSRCHRAICSRSCENGGRCLRPNRCQCYNGFQPPYCQTKVIPKSRRRSGR
ncbi:hypothetical protein SNE40_011671 [Patella caerulea]|uniref:Sushi, von Willebrand factor type A, EGF and pentraxin domain-containing protein 1 n=2 Tax=Patella caerulea TaxID=87958 RepID=A0AAN8JQH6_PATCE